MTSKMTERLNHGTRCLVAECIELDLGDKGKKMRARITSPYMGWSSFSLLICESDKCDLCSACLKKPKIVEEQEVPAKPKTMEEQEVPIQGDSVLLSLRKRLLAVRAGPNPMLAPDGCKLTDPLELELMQRETHPATAEDIKSKVENALTKARMFAGKTSTKTTGRREGSDMLIRLGDKETEHSARCTG